MGRGNGRLGGNVFLQFGHALIYLLRVTVSQERDMAERGMVAEGATYVLGFPLFFLRLGRQDAYVTRCSVGVLNLLKGGNGAS